jgi:hypothetical protein
MLLRKVHQGEITPLGLVVIFMYRSLHESEPPTGDLHPHTYAPAGRTPHRVPDRCLLVVWGKCEGTRRGGDR